MRLNLSIKNYSVFILVLLLLGFFGYLIYRQNTSSDKSFDSNKSIFSISSGRYPEFLAKMLVLDVELEDQTVWILITNKSLDMPIPAEEPHRIIVCTTELIDSKDKLIGRYPEYFKPTPRKIRDSVPSQQIAPNSTVKFGYDLTIPHGIIRVKLTYEDFSKAWRQDMPRLFIAEKEILF